MTSRELVVDTLEFRDPPRVPRHLWTLPWAGLTWPDELAALNAQIFCMDIEAIGRSFAGKLTFWGEVDRQHLLPYGSPAEVAAAVRTARGALWRGGGAIAQCEFGTGARPENVAAVFEAWSALT
jgi:hypothetical protein